MSTPAGGHVTVKYGTCAHEVLVEPSTTLGDLQDALARLTCVLARQQKLIHKGKVLSGSDRTLVALGIQPGTTIMMLATGGQQQQQQLTRGQAAATSLAAERAAATRARVEALYASAKGLPSTAERSPLQLPSTNCDVAGPVPQLEERRKGWRATGLLVLRDMGLAALPADLLPDPGPARQPPWQDVLRVVDVSGNRLACLPSGMLAALPSLTALRLSNNQLDDAGVQWDELARLHALTRLEASSNRLTSIPGDALACLPLRSLDLSRNSLAGLPEDCWGPGQQLGRTLQSLRLDGNHLAALPTQLGECTPLVELSATDNLIAAIPPSLAACTALQALRLDNNRVNAAGVPAGLLQACSSLWLLGLAGNPVTVQELREVPGFGALDARRQARANKQLGGRVLLEGTSTFFEGADTEAWAHWGPAGSGPGTGPPGGTG